ncbi:NAD(P)/FAD-dependent oxidoreductase [Enemella sp. A6]|uniref:NAD(P)/FAD-dependent oxidoreductase n=1 Tax=Enemella sp. A6 TaxID=3440152 RepID=UPI003EC05EAA
MGGIVIAGGGLSAVRTASSLRRKGYDGDLTMLAEEAVAPYDRPPLSKDVLLGTRDSTTLPFDTDKLAIDLRLGTRAMVLDPAAKQVRVEGSDGPGRVDYDRLLIATGATPIRMPGDGHQHLLRTADDALALREKLAPGVRVVLIGGSWIGAEVATSALARGCEVICIEATDMPLAAVLGPQVARHLKHWWEAVQVYTGCPVSRVDEGRVLLADGIEIEADVVVTGVGVRPNIGWLADSGLELNRGVIVDEHLRTSAPDVVAVGDVTERWSPRAGAHLVGQHWDDASSGGAVAAATLLGDISAGYDPVPYFWSDQFGHKLQYVGAHGPDDRAVPEFIDDLLSAVSWVDPAGNLTAWLGIDRPRDVMKARTAVGGPYQP